LQLQEEAVEFSSVLVDVAIKKTGPLIWCPLNMVKHAPVEETQ